MSLRVIGGAGGRTPVSSSYTVAATITSNSGLSVTPNVPTAPVVTQATMVATDKKTSFYDLPGVSSSVVRTFTPPSSYQALRSAAINTAAAFGLNTIKAADRASRYQEKTTQAATQGYPIVLDVVIIPK